MVGGVSIGSFIGGLYSQNEDIWYVYWKAKEFSSRVASRWRQALDLTYPLAAWFSGNECTSFIVFVSTECNFKLRESGRCPDKCMSYQFI
jgi:hypothetical protein